VSEARPARRVPTFLFCAPFYFLAAMALAFELLPSEALAIFGGKPRGDTLRITLGVGSLAFTIGAILHAWLYRRDPEAFDAASFRWVGITMATVLAFFFALSFVLARATGLPPRVLSRRFNAAVSGIGLVVVGLAVLVIVASLALLLAMARGHPANRMARRAAAGDLAGAIRIGESLPPEKRDFTANANLALVYALSGRKPEAEAILAALERTEGIPEYYTEETFRQTLVQLGEVVRGTSPPDRTVSFWMR
jgi:hypothetical protein